MITCRLFREKPCAFANMGYRDVYKGKCQAAPPEPGKKTTTSPINAPPIKTQHRAMNHRLPYAFTSVTPTFSIPFSPPPCLPNTISLVVINPPGSRNT